jgi:putative ABC transport system substrate-binding protein
MRDASGADLSTKVVRVGYLEVVKPGGPPMLIVQELHKLGYIEGKNLVMEYRSANGNPEHLAAAAAELVKLNADIIYAVSNPSAFAAKRATRTHSDRRLGCAWRA